ncbi:MAG: EVE domain-containing protein [Nitrospirae bacterium]|nr:EVE domain-containing protein [Nitrospirota bacterium]MBI3594715.1 EVE domain-containing protein [Nitrospirota bacterium]
MTEQHWLLKSEPSTFSIEDLEKSRNGTASWDGVRNYQARNFLRDQIKKGDGVLFYHSSSDSIGIAGEAVVVREGYPDPSAFNPADPHYDPKSVSKSPTWFTIEIMLVRKCREIISLKQLRTIPSLQEMKLLQRGMRLSVQPVTAREWEVIMTLPQWGPVRKSKG